MCKFTEAVATIQEAINIHHNPEERKKELVASMLKTQSNTHKQQVEFNEVMYRNFLCTTMFMDERNKEAVEECDKGIEAAKRFDDLSKVPEGAIDLTAASAFAEQAEK